MLTSRLNLYVGERRTIILPNTDAHGALFIAKNTSRKLAQKKLPHIKPSVSKYITCSMGIATTVPNLQQSVKDIIQNADRLLYKVKSSGRN